ncbi:MAG TPA: hypothetical protein VER55_13420, partial [Ardenticatenaceae bacterium]|nr:hypothetical protein [Ardenticatenaceae bacterium]
NTNGTTSATIAGTRQRIALAHRNTGFADPAGNPTSAFPNQLQSIVIRGNRAYLPNIAASPSGPLKFNVDTQAFVNVIGNVAGAESDVGALNLHLGAREPEAGKPRLFFANPWAIAFTTQTGAGNAYVVSAGSDLLVKLNVDNAGALSFTVDDNTTRYIDLNPNPGGNGVTSRNAGKNPLGIVICNDCPTSGTDKAYVMNYISRNVTVVNVENDSIVKSINLTALPPPGSKAEQIHVGAEIFFSSRGHFVRPQGTTVSTNDRLSSEGWQNCASCHFAGLTDGIVWAFGAGPRKSVPLNGTWSPINKNDQRVLNYSAIFDEVQDFELNIRNVSGPGPLSAGPPPVLDPNHGLLIGDNINQAPAAVPPLIPIKNAGRPQLSVRLPGSNKSWPALDAMTEWVRFGVRSPNGMLTRSELSKNVPAAGITAGLPEGGLNRDRVAEGRQIFIDMGCARCHAGTKWTLSQKDFQSPPAAEEVFTESDPNGPGVAPDPIGAQYLDRFLSDVGTFGKTGPANIGAAEKTHDNKDALGKDHNGDGRGAGFNIPSLLSIWQLPPYFHNGSCEDLLCVLSNAFVAHRQAGLDQGDPDLLNDAANRERLANFLRTLDAQTFFPTNLTVRTTDLTVDPPQPKRGTTATIRANVQLFGVVSDLKGNLQVNFTIAGGALNQNVALPPSAFNQDFGFATVETPWQVPANSPSNVTLVVTVDVGAKQKEANENDNTATRGITVKAAAAASTLSVTADEPPTVTAAFISDEEPFNLLDPFAASPNVRVRFTLTDVDGADDLASYCIVGYHYDAIERRWVRQDCEFAALPAPDGDGNYTVAYTLPTVDGAPVEGAAYAFVWAQDDEGNISRRPGIDVISVLPPDPIELAGEQFQVYRILVPAGQQVTLTAVFRPEDEAYGDVDLWVYNGINVDSPLIEMGANNGPVTDTVTFANLGDTARPFHVEVRNADDISRFRLGAEFAPAGAYTPEPDPDFTPLVAGPPAIGAIGDLEIHEPPPGANLYLPFISNKVE